MKNILIYIFAIAFVIVSIFAYIQTVKLIEKGKTQKTLFEQVESLTTQNLQQQQVIDGLSELKTYQITLSPNVTNKLNTTFGSQKQITMQYYFTMDGNSIELKPDTTINLTR